MRARTRAIRRDIKQTKPFAGPAEAATVALLRTADVIRSDIERTLGERGVTLQQFNVLRILRGSHPDSMATLAIAERMIERAPGITRLLDRLEAAGLVSRKRCREDRRRMLCSITEKGMETLARTDEPVRETERRRAGRLSPEDHVKLLELLDQLRRNVS